MNLQQIIILAVIIAVILLLILLIIRSVKTKNFTVLRKVAFYLVVQAEEKFGTGTGHIKYVWVVEQIEKYLPPVFKKLLSSEDIDNAIEFAVYKLKQYLAEKEKEEAAKAAAEAKAQADAEATKQTAAKKNTAPKIVAAHVPTQAKAKVAAKQAAKETK